jgi:CRP-like cAMP-binding protein
MFDECLKNDKIKKVILGCPLFVELDERELGLALDFFDARPKQYKKGEFLQSVLAPFERFGLVISGSIQVCCDDIDGHPMIMANVSEGDIFGESLCFTKAESPVYIRAAADSLLLTMTTNNIYSADLSNAESKKFTLRFTSILAKKALSMNDRIQILSKITLREKILTLLNQYRHRFDSNEFLLPFDRADMAIYLGADRSALSRELSKLKQDGIIDFKKNHFIIK